MSPGAEGSVGSGSDLRVESTSASSGPDPVPGAPWVETRAGGMFFVNAILVAPIYMALYPWTLRWLLRTAGILNRPSKVLDPVPAVADHVIPILGWLSIPAAWHWSRK